MKTIDDILDFHAVNSLDTSVKPIENLYPGLTKAKLKAALDEVWIDKGTTIAKIKAHQVEYNILMHKLQVEMKKTIGIPKSRTDEFQK